MKLARLNVAAGLVGRPCSESIRRGSPTPPTYVRTTTAQHTHFEPFRLHRDLLGRFSSLLLVLLSRIPSGPLSACSDAAVAYLVSPSVISCSPGTSGGKLADMSTRRMVSSPKFEAISSHKSSHTLSSDLLVTSSVRRQHVFDDTTWKPMKILTTFCMVMRRHTMQSALHLSLVAHTVRCPPSCPESQSLSVWCHPFSM